MSLSFRVAKPEDLRYLITWFSDPGVEKWFPMSNKLEVEDAARICLSYAPIGAAIIALWNGEPCGLANIYVQSYKKLAHQALFAIIVAPDKRGRGIGTFLIKELIRIAKEQLKIELLHLEVYEGNPAKSLYDKLGFEVCGFQKHFLKEGNGYRGKYFMQKDLRV